MKLAEAFDNYADMSARRSAAVMFRDVKLDARAAHLHVKRHTGLEPMLPVHGETEKVDIELARLDFVEAAEHWHRLDERKPSGHGHQLNRPIWPSPLH